MLSSRAERWAHLHKACVKCLYDVFFRAITFTGIEDCTARRVPAAAASLAPCLEGPRCCPVPPPWPRERWQRRTGTAVPCSLVYSCRAGLLAAWGKTRSAHQEKKFCETELAVTSPLRTTATLLTQRGHPSPSPAFYWCHRWLCGRAVPGSGGRTSTPFWLPSGTRATATTWVKHVGTGTGTVGTRVPQGALQTMGSPRHPPAAHVPAWMCMRTCVWRF